MGGSEQIDLIRANMRRVIRGKDGVIDLLLVALAANGHVLIEDVPGVGKTTLAKALAYSITGVYHRIQFTPDLLPADIVGGMVYSPKTGDFTFRPGPVFCNILLADEINRASPRTQSALLEAMSERQVTTEGTTRALEPPFMVMATQNPVEYQGTYPLPEAQLDRFALQITVGYPSEQDEISVVLDQREAHPLDSISPVVELADVLEIQKGVRNIAVEESVTRYMVEMVRATRNDPRVSLGASPRAALALYRAAQARAFLEEREFVLPDDVKALAPHVLVHRFILDLKARHSGETNSAVISDILASVRVPV